MKACWHRSVSICPRAFILVQPTVGAGAAVGILAAHQPIRPLRKRINVCSTSTRFSSK